MSTSKTLQDLNVSLEKGTITGFAGDALVGDRLKEMGIHLGIEVTFVGKAPFRGPRLYKFGNTVLALRKEEAVCALIQI